MKNYSFFISLLMVMLLSVGNVWADKVTFAFGDYKGKGTTTTGSEYTMVKEDVSIGDTKFYGNNSYAHFYANGVTTITPASGVTITEIVLTASADKYNGYQSSGTMTWSTGSSSVNNAVVTWTGSATAAFTLTHNKQIRWTSIVVTYSKESGGTPTCATPTFDPEDGETFTDDIDVEIACETDGATIYYTTNGSNPTISSNVYSSALNFTATTTLKAMAVKAGYVNSAVAAATYTKVVPFSGSILEIVKGDFTTSSYDDNAGDHEKSGIMFTTAKVYQSGGGIQFQKTNGLLYNKTDLGEIAKIEITTVSGKSNNLVVYSGTTENPTSGAVTGSTSGSVTTYTFAAGKGFFAIKCNSTGASNVDPIKIYYTSATPSSVDKPTISGTESFVTSTTVTISHADADHIYYTTNGDAPTTSSTLYSAPFSLTNTATVKAIAVKGNVSSDVAEKTFTKVEALTTMDAIFAAATTAGSTATDKYITFNNWVVTGVKNSNVYVTDGTKGFIIYQSSHGFAVGDVLNGTVACKVQLYSGAAELTTLTKTTQGLSVSTGGVATINELDAEGIAALSGVNTGSLIKVSGECTTESTNYYIAGVQLYNTLFAFDAPTAGKNYNCSGVYVQFNSTKEMLPRSAADIEEIVEEGAPEAPTFSPAAGTYTEVQSVTLSCETQGATIYYTTDGTTPTSSSAVYSSAISVGETMTIKAIAIKNEIESALATAAYTINLTEDENTSKTWDLSIDETVSASTTELTWTATYVDMVYAKETSTTNANNYYPGTSGKSYTSTRFYTNGVLTITPKNKQITSIVFAATSSSYATALANSTWTNATAVASESNVVVTAAGAGAVSAVIGATCGLKTVRVAYTDVDTSIPAEPTFSLTAGTYTEAQSVTLACETQGATIYYTTDGSTPTNASTQYTTAISVGETMTIKAVAIKDDKSSPVATATYTINLPEDENISKTWDLTVVSCDENPTDDLMQWTAPYVTMSIAKGSGTKVTNYYPGTSGQSYTSTRFYKDNILTITPNGKQITTITFAATTSGYATALASSTWTNATAEANGTNVVVTAAGAGAVSAVIGATCGFTKVRVVYTDVDTSIPAEPVVPEPDYTRSITAGQFGTICLPNSGRIEGATIFEIAHKKERKIFFDEISEATMVAGRPYIFYPNNGASELKVYYTESENAAAGTYNGLYGSYVQSQLAKNDGNYILYDNKYYLVDSEAYVGANRAYIKLGEVPTEEQAPAPGRRRVSMDVQGEQVATSIINTHYGDQPMKVMIDNQLYIIRAGQMFDMTGNKIK